MRKSKLLVIFGFALCPAAWGQVPDLRKIPVKTDEQIQIDEGPSGVPALTAQDLEAFLDGILPQQLKVEDIAGATLVMVKDGSLLLAKGYGYSDYEKRTPVSAEETLFRPGSVSKLFTWTAVMQLFEQGKLDLDRDINEYLDYKIPEAFGQPITLKNILTHSPGFEEQIKDIFKTTSQSPDLGSYLKTHIPHRIFPPGQVPAYSNYGAALAGYIVERVSGLPFNDYIDANIFQPLGMTRSTFAQPLPAALAPLMSKGYRQASDKPEPFEVVGPYPAGSLSSPAADMARFMLAHLQGGELEGARILKPETVELMHSRLLGLHPEANGMAYGFYEESLNGQRIVGHGGDTICFHSDLHLIPEAGIGFFISYNSAGKGQSSPRSLLWEAVMDRYFPYTPSELPTLAGAEEDARSVSGTYIPSRRSGTSFLKAAALLGEATVSAAGDGMIEVAQLTAPNGKPIRWREVAPMTFLEEHGQNKLVFRPGEDGDLEMIVPFPFFIFQRTGVWENKSILLPVLGVSMLIILLTLILWPVAALVRRHYSHRLELTPQERLLRVGVRTVLALDLIFVVALTGLVVYGTTHLDLFSDSGNKWFYLVQGIGVLGALGSLLVLYNAVRVWLRRDTRIWGKLQAGLFVVACLGLLWFALAGKLLSFSSSY